MVTRQFEIPTNLATTNFEKNKNTIRTNQRFMMRKKLQDWGDSNQKIKKLNKEIYSYKLMLEEEYGTTPNFDYSKIRSSSGTFDQTAKKIFEIDKLSEVYDKEIYKIQKKIIKIIQDKETLEMRIEDLKMAQKEILCLRYLQKLTWKQIGCKCYFHVDYARKLERLAVDDLILN